MATAMQLGLFDVAADNVESTLAKTIKMRQIVTEKSFSSYCECKKRPVPIGLVHELRKSAACYNEQFDHLMAREFEILAYRRLYGHPDPPYEVILHTGDGLMIALNVFTYGEEIIIDQNITIWRMENDDCLRSIPESWTITEWGRGYGLS